MQAHASKRVEKPARESNGEKRDPAQPPTRVSAIVTLRAMWEILTSYSAKGPQVACFAAGSSAKLLGRWETLIGPIWVKLRAHPSVKQKPKLCTKLCMVVATNCGRIAILFATQCTIVFGLATGQARGAHHKLGQAGQHQPASRQRGVG